MADIYVRLTYDEYKALEEACKKFKETVHGEGTEWYHKAIRLPVGDTNFEFHGPSVMSRLTERSK